MITLNSFSKNALAFAITTSLPVLVSAETAGQLPTVQVESQQEHQYTPTQSISHKQTQPLLDTAKTITTIPQSLMQDRGVENLRDALRNVPGISLAAGEGGTPTGDSLHIRGFDARTDILIDGIRDIAGYSRDTYNLEAVEVSKGPASAVTGRGSTGGSINLQTKTAKLDDVSEVGASIGTANDYRITLDSNHTFGETSALRINLLTDDGEVAGRDEVENSKNAIAISLATGLGTKSRFTLNADYQKQDNLPDYGIPWVSAGQSSYATELADSAGGAPDVDYSNFYGNVYRDFEDIRAQSLTGLYEYDLSDNTRLRVQGRIGSVDRVSVVTAPRFLSIADSTAVRLSDEKTRDTRNTLRVLQFDLVGHYQWGDIQHDVVSGVEIARERETRWNYDDNGSDNLDTTPETVDLYHPNAHVNYSGHYRSDGSKTEAVGDTRAIYLFDTMTFNPQWELTLGARWESFKTEYQYDYTDSALVLAAEDNLFSWNSAIVYKPSANGSIYFGVGNAFNPSAQDLTASTSGNSSKLDPEESISYELGTKWSLLQGRLLSNAALFRTEKTNALTDAPDGAFANDDGRFDQLNGKQRVQGLELSLYGEISAEFNLTAAYTFQDSEVLKAEGDDISQQGNALPRTPRHAASLWGHYTLSEQWATGLGVQYIGKRYNSSDATTREQADGYSTLDMMVSYQATPQLRLQLNGSNITDTEYEDQLGGGHFIPGEARHFRLNANYSF